MNGLAWLALLGACGGSPAGQTPARRRSMDPAPTEVAAGPVTPAVALSERSACTISAEGDVICWGEVTGSPRPVHVPSTSGAIALGRALMESYCALRSGGSVVCWHYGSADGEPRELFHSPGATELAVAWRRTCARAPGQAPQCRATGTLTEDAIDLGPDVQRILAVGPRVCALRSSHELFCPDLDDPIADVVDAAADDDRVCVATRTRVRCANAATIDLRAQWTDVAGLDGAEQIAVGKDGVCARIGARVRCASTQGTTDVQTESAPLAIATVERRTCVRLASGVSCFGEVGGGILGEVPRGPLDLGLRDVVEISAALHSCARTASGEVYCWGPNDRGAIGDGTRVVHFTPSRVPNLTGALEVVAGYQLSCARGERGISCWGGDEDDPAPRLVAPGPVVDWQVASPTVLVLRPSGDVETFDAMEGGRSPSPDLPARLRFRGAVELGAMRFAVCARTADGRVTCTGRSSNGEMGSQPAEDEAAVGVPLPAPRPASQEALELAARGCRDRACGEPVRDAARLVADGFWGCVVLSTGGVGCWGSNQSHEVSPSDVDPVRVPLLRDDVRDAADVCVGSNYACVARRDGRVHCWGFASPTTDPAVFGTLENVRSIACGTDHACALLGDGTVRCWGSAAEGRLGSAQLHLSAPRLVAGTR